MTQEHPRARALPPLPLDEWEDHQRDAAPLLSGNRQGEDGDSHRTGTTGGTLRSTSPPAGLTTGPIPYGLRSRPSTSLSICDENRLDRDHRRRRRVLLRPGRPAGRASSTARLFEGLESLGIHASINPKPFGLDDEHALDV